MWWLPVLFLLLSAQAGAQSADCAPLTQAPPGASLGGAGPVLPLAIDLARRPGVPRGVSGQVYVDIPIEAYRPLECGGVPPGPSDVLHGPPGDVLHGPPAANLLRGQGAPVVRMEPVTR